MLISVVLTAYNAEQWIEETIESILAQSYRDLELIIVNDGSTDNTLCIIRRYAQQDNRIRVLTHDNQGMAASANLAVSAAKGDWIARIDADDLMLPQRIERQVAFIRANPDVVAASSFIYYINSTGDIVGSYKSDLTTRKIFNEYYAKARVISVPHQGVIMRKDVFQQLGGYRGEYWSADDTDLWNRMAEVGYVLLQPEYLQKYRIHGSSISNTTILTQLWKLRWIETSVRRRRAGLPEPTWDEFNAEESSRPRLTRLNTRRKMLGHAISKRGALAYSNGDFLATFGFLACGSILYPSYVVRQIIFKYLRNRLGWNRNNVAVGNHRSNFSKGAE